MSKKTRSKRYVGVYHYKGVNGKCLWINYKLNGRTKWEKIGWDYEGYTEKTAQRIRGDRIRDINHGVELDTGSRDLTLSEAFKGYMEWATASNKPSARTDRYRYGKHLSHLDHRLLSQISVADLERLKVKMLKNGLAPGSIQAVMDLLKKVINRAILLDRYTGNNPVKKIPTIHAHNTKTRFFSYEEADILLGYLINADKTMFMQTAISLFAGLRRSEVMRLLGREIDLEKRLIHVVDFKSSGKAKERWVGICDELYNILKDVPKKPHEPVFKKFQRTKFTNAVKKLGFNDGVTDRLHRATFHTLRHTFASWLAMDGVDIYTIMELLGHSNIKMTMRYAHLIPDQKNEAVQNMGRNFKRSRSKLSVVK